MVKGSDTQLINLRVPRRQRNNCVTTSQGASEIEFDLFGEDWFAKRAHLERDHYSLLRYIILIYGKQAIDQ